MRYLLDTTTLIDFSKGREPATSKLLELIESGNEVGLCAINVAEFYSGLPSSGNKALDNFMASLIYWDISRIAAAKAGTFRYLSAKKGRSITIADALIAYAAFEAEAVLVTDNKKDYPINLEIISLRE